VGGGYFSLPSNASGIQTGLGMPGLTAGSGPLDRLSLHPLSSLGQHTSSIPSSLPPGHAGLPGTQGQLHQGLSDSAEGQEDNPPMKRPKTSFPGMETPHLISAFEKNQSSVTYGAGADGEKSKGEKIKGDRSKLDDLKIAAEKLKSGSAEKHSKKSIGKSGNNNANGEDKPKGLFGDKSKASSDKSGKQMKMKGESKTGKDGEKSDSIVVSGSEKEDEGGAFGSAQDSSEWREGTDLEAAIAFLKQQKKAALLQRRTDHGEDGGDAGGSKKSEDEDEEEEEDLRWMRGSGADSSDGPRDGDMPALRGPRDGVSNLLQAFSYLGLFPRTSVTGGEEDAGQGLEALHLDEALKYVVLLLMQEGIYARKLQVCASVPLLLVAILACAKEQQPCH
jgi:hypothetical protein